MPYTLKLSQKKLSQNQNKSQNENKFNKIKQENVKTRSSKIHTKIHPN